ncbi:GtrA family protein [Mangrovimicrobium sediminis]|uniref:GtrA family protein n=1 Tax=Mangrovimicrobium sediminis TaxID=2562682 RepID=A0A4Z0LWK5_9GAMM|nr:GtrA family protein [Haliea sp. SAOS-164]TGD71722.1 GtrA family protein [Haliea sp. SAOS-164]
MARGLRFGVVGVVTAALHYGTLYLGVAWLGQGSTAASSVGFVVAVSFNYAMHYYWTFADGVEAAPHGRALRRYAAMVAVGFVLNALVMYLGVHGLHWHYLLAQAAALVVVVAWNFTLANAWVFRA